MKAIFSKFQLKGKKDGEEKESVEIYNALGKIATSDLTAAKRHGKFYADGKRSVFIRIDAKNALFVSGSDSKI